MKAYLDYYESAQEVVISKARALKELSTHGVDDELTVRQFFAELGEADYYNAQEVLDFLGY